MRLSKAEKAFLEKYRFLKTDPFPINLPRFGSKLGDMSDSDCQILSRIVDSIDKLTLSENEISNEGVAFLSKIKIRILDLDGNYLDDSCLRDLAKIQSLEVLNIRHTDISAEGLKYLVHQLHHLKEICHTLDESDREQTEELASHKPDIKFRINFS